jgi:cell division protein FtsL
MSNNKDSISFIQDGEEIVLSNIVEKLDKKMDKLTIGALVLSLIVTALAIPVTMVSLSVVEIKEQNSEIKEQNSEIKTLRKENQNLNNRLLILEQKIK